MDELVEGAKVYYELSEQEAQSINQFVANHPDPHAATARAHAGQRVPATVVLSRGPNHAGEQRLAVRLDGPGPDERSYHVWASELHFSAGAWHKTVIAE